MRRREFLGVVGGAAVSWPLATRTEPAERMRRIGVLSTGDDAEGHTRLAAFAQALKQLGWNEGRNLRTDTRYATADNVHRHATELVALAPDVLVAATGTAGFAGRTPNELNFLLSNLSGLSLILQKESAPAFASSMHGVRWFYRAQNRF